MELVFSLLAVKGLEPRFGAVAGRGRKPTKKRMRRAAKAVPKNLCLGVQGSLSDSSNRVIVRIL